jgi:hypothetical protein
MIEFDFRRSSRRCHVSGQEFKPGEVYYSVLVEQGDELQRMDFSESSWPGPPPNAVGWWRSQVPSQDRQRVYWAPNDVLLAYFQQLYHRPEKQETCYVMSLLLQRKRLLSAIESRPRAEETGRETVLRSARLDAEFVVAECPLSVERMRVIQEELCEHLFMDQPELAADAES